MKNIRNTLSVLSLLVIATMFNQNSAVAAGSIAIGGSSSASITASAVCPGNGGTCSATMTTALGVRMPFSLTIWNLYASQTSSPASATTCAFTIRKSIGCTGAYASTGITCSLSGTAKTCQDNTHSATVAAGDCLQLMFVETGTCSGYINWGLQGDYM
jgi:hypothetical protein